MVLRDTAGHRPAPSSSPDLLRIRSLLRRLFSVATATWLPSHSVPLPLFAPVLHNGAARLMLCDARDLV